MRNIASTRVRIVIGIAALGTVSMLPGCYLFYNLEDCVGSIWPGYAVHGTIADTQGTPISGLDITLTMKFDQGPVEG